jgi:hypothetical protein
MQICLSEAYAIIDHERGKCLEVRGKFAKGSEEYDAISERLRMLNRLKKEFARRVSNTDQLPLGL